MRQHHKAASASNQALLMAVALLPTLSTMAASRQAHGHLRASKRAGWGGSVGGRDGFQGSGACPFDKVCAAHRRGSGPSKRKRCRRQDNQGREDHSMKPAPTSLDGGSGDFDLEALGGAIVLPPNFHELVARRQLWICAHRQNTHLLRWS